MIYLKSEEQFNEIKNKKPTLADYTIRIVDFKNDKYIEIRDVDTLENLIKTLEEYRS